MHCHEDMVFMKAINKLSENSFCGQEGFPSILLKECKCSIATPLQIIWNLSMDTGMVPSKTKHAFVIPVLKSGYSKLDSASFRPISLTSYLIKVYERYVKSRFKSFIEDS